MPVTTSRSGLQIKIRGVEALTNSPDLIIALGTYLATTLVKNTPVAKGYAAAAISKVGEPERLPSGWAIGIGDKSKTGMPEDSAPAGVLRDFFEYLKDMKEKFRITNWWGLSPEHKQMLEEQRRSGKFGGLGPDYANYIWVQNYGNTKAGITGRHFIEDSLEEFRKEAPRIIEEYLATKP